MGLQFRLTSEKEVYGFHEPVNLTLHLLNNSETAVTINGRLLVNLATSPKGLRDVTLNVTGPVGYENGAVFQVNAGLPALRDVVTLSPGEEKNRLMDLTNYESLDVAGMYTVTAVYQSELPITGADVWQGTLESTPIVITRQ